MVFLKALLLVVLVLSCLMLIGLILLQKTKSEGLGMAFGAGTGEMLFGSRAGNVLSKATVILGIVFMVTALILGVLFAQKDQTLMDRVASEAPARGALQPLALDALDLEVATDVVPVEKPQQPNEGM